VRAYGRLDPEALEKLRGGITLEGVHYGPIEARIDKVQGDNVWLAIAIREGKNREVKKICEHLGLEVNRLIRTAFGPFQLGELERGQVAEVPARVLAEQLGRKVSVPAGVAQKPARRGRA
jgi:23S rRNA pseudouridine2605 synthase